MSLKREVQTNVMKPWNKKVNYFTRPNNQGETQGRTMRASVWFYKTTHTKSAKGKNHHVFPCFLRQKHFRAVIRHAQGSSPWGASIQRLALAIEVPQQSWWWEQAVSVSKYGEIFCAKILAGRVRNTVENFVGCDEGGFAVGRRHVWKPECAK